MTAPPDPLLALVSFGRHRVPGIWRFFLPEDFFELAPPLERLATCDACTKVARNEFRADCQCCTYFPQIPNFMLGLALDSPTARPHIEALIAGGHVLPQGLLASPAQFKTAIAAYSDDLFGKLPAMVCPFIEPRSFDCLVYPWRNSICSTFFCTFDHGETGDEFWTKLQALVGYVETALGQWALDAIGFGCPDLMRRLDAWADRIPEASEPTTGAWSPALRAALWGDWLGREAELLRACARQVREHEAELYALACAQPFREPLIYERAVRDWIPAAIRDNVPRVAEAPGMSDPIEDLWYKLQLAARRLWELPFNEGAVRLNDRARLVDNDGSVPGCGDGPLLVTCGERTMAVSAAQAKLLRLFARPQVLGEALFARDEVTALDEPRRFLAECLRSELLVPSDRSGRG